MAISHGAIASDSEKQVRFVDTMLFEDADSNHRNSFSFHRLRNASRNRGGQAV